MIPIITNEGAVEICDWVIEKQILVFSLSDHEKEVSFE